MSVPFPMPNDDILGGTVVASVWYDDNFDELQPYARATVVLLMPKAPFYQVGIVWLEPGQYRWEDKPYEHENIVPAIGGMSMKAIRKALTMPQKYGYCDLGGEL